MQRFYKEEDEEEREEGSGGAECVVRVFVLGWGKATFQ